MANDRRESLKSDLTPMNLRVPEPLKQKFREWCRLNRREMTDVLIECMERIVEGDLPIAAKYGKPAVPLPHVELPPDPPKRRSPRPK